MTARTAAQIPPTMTAMRLPLLTVMTRLPSPMTAWTRLFPLSTVATRLPSLMTAWTRLQLPRQIDALPVTVTRPQMMVRNKEAERG